MVKSERAVVSPSSSRPRSDTASSTSTVVTAGPGTSASTVQENGVDIVPEGIDLGKGEEQLPLPLEAKPASESGCTIS